MSVSNQIKALDHVALHVADLQLSIQFYDEVLGLTPLSRPSFDFEGAWFALGNSQQLHLIAGRIDPVMDKTRGNHFAVEVFSIQNIQTFLESKGIAFRGPKKRPDGPWQLFIKDPDGHILEFTQL